MKIKMFYHSLISDWNHGNAHFLRGICSSLIQKGHEVEVFEPSDGWSRSKAIELYGPEKVNAFYSFFPQLKSTFYDLAHIDLEQVLHEADMVLVHEWNQPSLVKQIGEHRMKNDNYRLFFHDTHHRSVSDKLEMEQYDLSHYDGVLAFGNTIRNLYLQNGWATNVWTWHEAADTTVFYPREKKEYEGDLVWIGNWGDDERTEELMEFIIKPVKELGLKAKFYGVRYPQKAIDALADAGIEYGQWLPNYRAPEVFSKYRFTVHVPRRPYVEKLPGIPTIRPFEALACKIPLICSPWDDTEGLFHEGKDYVMVHNKEEMKSQMKNLIENEEFASQLSENGLATIREKHTCEHRVEQLLKIYQAINEQKEPISTHKIIAHG